MNSLPLASLKVPSIPGLSPVSALLAVISIVKAKLGVNLLAPNAAAKLNAALTGPASTATAAKAAVSASVDGSAQLSSLTSAASALGVDLSAPGGGASLAAALNKLASLQMSLNVSPASLASLAGFLASLGTLQGAGINLLAGGGNPVAQLQAALAPLNALNSVSLSPSSLQAAAAQLAAPAAGQMAAKAAGQMAASASGQMAAKAGQSVSASGQIIPSATGGGSLAGLTPKDLSALASVQMPNLAPMLNVSTVMKFATANSACGSACPLSFVP